MKKIPAESPKKNDGSATLKKSYKKKFINCDDRLIREPINVI